MSAKIGELVVELRASTAKFSTDLQDAHSKTRGAMAQIKESVDDLSESFQHLAELAGIASLGEFVKNSVEYAHDIGNLAKVMGDTVEQTSRLAYAAQQSDISVDQLSRTIGVLSKTLLAAQTGSKKDAALFSFLDVDPKKIGSSSDLLLKLVDTFSKLPPGIERTEVATALFNRTGVNMIPWLTSSTEELRKLMNQLDATGATVTAAQAEMSEKLTNAYKQIIGSAQSFTLELVTKLSPALLDSGKNFATWEEGVGGAKKKADDFAASLQEVKKWLDKISPSGLPTSYLGFDKSLGLGLSPQLSKGLAATPGDALFPGSGDQFSPLPPTPAAPAFPDIGKLSGDFLPQTPDQYKAVTGGAKDAQAAIDKLNESHQTLEAELSKTAASLQAEANAFYTGGDAAKAAANVAQLHDFATRGATTAQLAFINSLQIATSTAQGYSLMMKDPPKETDKLQKAWDSLNAKNATAQMLEMGEAMRGLGADAPLGQNYWDSILGNAAQEQALAMGKRVNEVTNDLQHQLDLVRASPSDYLLMTAGIQHADEASKEHYLDIARTIEQTQELQHAWSEFGRDAAESISELLFDSKSLGEAVGDLAKKIGEAALQWTLFGANGKTGLLGDLGGLIGIPGLSSSKSGVSSLFGIAAGDIPGLAVGGPAAANKPYIIGEAGPELFVPGGSGGTVIPNGQFGGGNVTNIYYNVDARGAQVGFAQQIAAALKATEDRAVNRSVKTVKDMSLRTA